MFRHSNNLSIYSSMILFSYTIDLQGITKRLKNFDGNISSQGGIINKHQCLLVLNIFYERSIIFH